MQPEMFLYLRGKELGSRLTWTKGTSYVQLQGQP